MLGAVAFGQFCIVMLSVRNIGDKAVHYNANFQKAFTDAGESHDPDIAACWHLIETRPAQEGIACMHLVDRRFGLYVPILHRDVMQRGRIVMSGTADEVHGRIDEIEATYLSGSRDESTDRPPTR